MILYNNKKQKLLTLDTSKEINRGGEGAIFVHPQDKSLVVKVYHTIGGLSEQALKELMALPPEFIKPMELFYDLQGNLKGLSMKYLDTNKMTLLSHVFNKGTAAKLGFDTTKKKTICANLCKSLIAAHKTGIVVGDLNPYNIFVDSQGGVYFIDVDSYQTKSRPHSGVLLPEVRDWLTYNINQETDYYALSVLLFQLFTYIHPYKGVHTKYRTLEERMVHHLSVLSGDNNIKLPGFYEPLTSVVTNTEFTDIFQRDQRRIPSTISGATFAPPVIPKPISIQLYKEGDLTVRPIAAGITEIESVGNMFYAKKTDKEYLVYTSLSHGDTGKSVSMFGDKLLMGRKNLIMITGNKLVLVFDGRVAIPIMPITNFYPGVGSIMHCTNGYAVFLDDTSDTYSLLSLDQVHNNKSVHFTKNTIFVPSVSIGTGGIVQTIPSMKAILDISQGVLKTVRTKENVTDICLTRDGTYGVVELKDNKGHIARLCKIPDMNLELGVEIPHVCSIVETKDYLFVPSDKAVDIYRKTDLNKIGTLPCSYVNEQSVLKHCNAGILCLTGSTLYLINKN